MKNTLDSEFSRTDLCYKAIFLQSNLNYSPVVATMVLGMNLCSQHYCKLYICAESGFFGFSDKCKTCLRVVGGNNFIFNVIYKWKTTVILS